MKLKMGPKFILLLLVLVIGTFDRHLSTYFPGEVNAMIQADAIPAHSDLPVKSCDTHEDITFRMISCCVPAPAEVSIQVYRVFTIPVPRISPHSMWQPPENKA